MAPKEEPAWRAVWNSLYRSEADFREAVDRLNDDIEKRLIVVPGEVLHAFGLYLWLADIGETQKKRAQVVAEAKEYIDDMYAKRSLQPLAENASAYRDFPVHEGLGFMEARTPEFEEILNHMEATRKKAAVDLYQSQAEELLKDMMENPDIFLRQISYSGGEARYANVPLLAAIDTRTFTASLLGLRLDAQRTVFSALKSRYQHNGLANDLASERAWLVSVRDGLLAEARTATPFTRYTISKNVDHFIQPLLDLTG